MILMGFVMKKAFTMAEVLVTIGIIGIVAAMTIPALINRYKTFVLMQQFKKVYSAIAVATEKVQFDMGENVKCFYGPGGSWADCPLFYNELAKQLNEIQVCNGKALERGCLPKEFYKKPEDLYKELYPDLGSDDEVNKYFSSRCPGFSTENIKNNDKVYVLNGGFLIITYYNRGSAPLFIVDINGKNRPNKWGHDLFIFQFEKRKLSDSYFVIEPTLNAGLVEKGGFTAIEFFNRINRGTANF